jgi:hypothetical protein
MLLLQKNSLFIYFVRIEFEGNMEVCKTLKEPSQIFEFKEYPGVRIKAFVKVDPKKNPHFENQLKIRNFFFDGSQNIMNGKKGNVDSPRKTDIMNGKKLNADSPRKMTVKLRENRYWAPYLLQILEVAEINRTAQTNSHLKSNTFE